MTTVHAHEPATDQPLRQTVEFVRDGETMTARITPADRPAQ